MMKELILYKFNREDGGVTVSLTKPEQEYTQMYRIVAEEGKLLTKDGDFLVSVIDVDSTDGWYEVDKPVNEGDEP